MIGQNRMSEYKSKHFLLKVDELLKEGVFYLTVYIHSDILYISNIYNIYNIYKEVPCEYHYK